VKNLVKQNIFGVFALLVSMAVGGMYLWTRPIKIGFVDSSQLMAGFSYAHRVETEVLDREKSWKSDQEKMQDSLDAFVAKMTVNYNKADAKRKREMQDDLSARNQEIANFVRANEKAQVKFRSEKMGDVYTKINTFMKEFGFQGRYDIVFGTVQGGNILYGLETRTDITRAVIEGINRKYR
jgi:outer membrane protein